MGQSVTRWQYHDSNRWSYPSRSDAQAVDLEQSEASYGPIRRPPPSARHEPTEGRSQEDISRVEEEILAAPQGRRNYNHYQEGLEHQVIGQLDSLLGANRGAGRGSGAATPSSLPPQGILVVRGPHSHSSRGDPWNEWEIDGHSATASLHGAGDRRVNPTIYAARPEPAPQPMRGPLTQEMPLGPGDRNIVPGTLN